MDAGADFGGMELILAGLHLGFGEKQGGGRGWPGSWAVRGHQCFGFADPSIDQQRRQRLAGGLGLRRELLRRFVGRGRTIGFHASFVEIPADNLAHGLIFFFGDQHAQAS